MDKLDKDLSGVIALDLAMADVLSLCKTSQKFNRSICKNPSFWRNRLQQDFPKVEYDKQNPQTEYIKLYKISNKFPELRPILSFLDFDRIDANLINTVYDLSSTVKTLLLLDVLKPEILKKIMKDYNDDPIYDSEVIKEPTRKDIVKFMNVHGMIYPAEYTGFYTCLITELEMYAKDPNFKFNPARWEVGFD